MGQNNCITAKNPLSDKEVKSGDNDDKLLPQDQKVPKISSLPSPDNNVKDDDSRCISIYNKDGKVDYVIDGNHNRVIHNMVVYENGETKQKAERSEIKLVFNLLRSGLKKFYQAEDEPTRYEAFIDTTNRMSHVFYLDLEMEELEREGDPIRHSTIELNDLLRKYVLSTGRKRLLIEGEAGFGKSGLAYTLARDWADGKPGFTRKFDLVIYYKLRDLGDKNLEEEIIKFCIRQSALKEELSADPEAKKDQDRVVVASLLKNSEDILIILDGYDEVLVDRRWVINDMIAGKKNSQQKVFRDSTIIVTTRPMEYPGHSSLYERVVRLNGLPEKNVEKYVQKFFNDEPEKASSLSELLKLKQVKIIHSMSPFMIDLICQLHKYGVLKEATMSQNILLSQLVTLMTHRCRERENLSLSDEDIETVLFHLGDFFYSQPPNERLVVPMARLQEAFGDEDLTLVTKCGLLNQRTKYDFDEESTYEILHKLFLEFLVTKSFTANLNLKSTDQDKCDYISTLINDSTPFSVLSTSINQTVIIAQTVLPNCHFFWDLPVLEEKENETSILSRSHFIMAEDIRALLSQSIRPSPLSLRFSGNSQIEHAEPLMPRNLKEKEALLSLLRSTNLHPFTLQFYLYQDSKYFMNLEEECVEMGLQCQEEGRAAWEAIVTWRRNQVLGPELVELGSKLKESTIQGDNSVVYGLMWMNANRWSNSIENLSRWLDDINLSILNPVPETSRQPISPAEVVYQLVPKLNLNKLGSWRGRLDIGRNARSSDIVGVTFDYEKIQIATSKGKFSGQEFQLEEYRRNQKKIQKLMDFTLQVNRPVSLSFEIHSSRNIKANRNSSF